MPTHEPSSSDAQLVLADRDRVERMLDRLPMEQRAVIVLHYHLGLPLPEVATTLAIPVGTAKSRLHRALESMRTAMLAETDTLTPVTEPPR